MKEESEKVIKALIERLEEHDNNRKAIQNLLHEICEGLKKEVDEMEMRINNTLEEEFAEEDNSIQSALNELRKCAATDKVDPKELSRVIQNAGSKLFIIQSYEIVKCEDEKLNISELYKLKTDRQVSSSWLSLNKPTITSTTYSSTKNLLLEVTLGADKDEAIEKNDISNVLVHKAFIYKDTEADGNEYVLTRENNKNTFSFNPKTLESETTYRVKVKISFKDKSSEWSDVTEFKTPGFSECLWKRCPDYVDWDRKYSVSVLNPRVATKIGNKICIIIGDKPLPKNSVTSWNVNILKSRKDDGYGIFIGVAASDIDQNVDSNYNERGWHFNCFDSTLISGAPHNYESKEYGLKKENGQYVHERDTIGVIMDTSKGDLSFVVNDVNFGVAYEGIPLDKPLVPCAILGKEGDSVELDLSSEIKENINNGIPAPSNVTIKNVTWDSITLTWDTIDGDNENNTSFYQIEIDGSRTWEVSATNTFTKRGFRADTEHNFRVRAVRGCSFSEWSDAVKEKTFKKSFETCAWKECPKYVDEKLKYSVDVNNTKIATSIGDKPCIIIGNTHLPRNKVTSWYVKLLETKNNGNGIFVGVAPFDINQNDDYNYNKCGYYLYLYESILYSGSPHIYRGKDYGARRKEGEYVRRGDTVGVVMNTANGELSFVVGGVNQGVAYTGIPLDKPLVPCVILGWKDNSVELDTSEVKENVVSSIPAPFYITIKSITWDSITFTWEAVKGASFYQVEVNNLIQEMVATNTFKKENLLPDTEHSFRVRTVIGNEVSEWYGPINGKTLNVSDFSECSWKDCPNGAGPERKYSLGLLSSKVATKNKYGGCCTIIGNTPLPFGQVVSWSVKILKSLSNNGYDILIGVAPFDISQDKDNSTKQCGWYLCCFDSTLYSGPPHNYVNKEYGPRKEKGKYVKTGDTVSITMDTTSGELSFILDNDYIGVAYERIPFDKPLVPCVLLSYGGDSVELNVKKLDQEILTF